MNINGIPTGYGTPAFWKNNNTKSNGTNQTFDLKRMKTREELESEKEAAKANDKKSKESETKTNLIVRPDGSKVLEISMKNGEIEMTTTMLISKPSVLQGERQNKNIDNHTENSIHNAARNSHIVYMKTDDMLYSGGNGTGLSFYIKYAKGSTEEDPTVIAKGVDENGNEFEQTIHINDINPRNATIVEMRALEAYTGVEKQHGFSSLPLSSGNMGLHERRNFMDMFDKTVNDMNLLKQWSSAAYYRYSMQVYGDFINRK